MKFMEIFRFEFMYQVRRLSTWLYFTALLTVACLFVRGNFLADALYADFFLNSPFVVAVVTVFCSLFWLLVVAGVAGEITARDVETGMHPLTYTLPVSTADYLGGRFMAAFILNALILLAVPLGVLISVYAPGVDAGIIGPFRPAAYLTSYGFLALPNAFIGTAIQFAWAALGRRALASYLGSVLLFAAAYGGIFAVVYFIDRQDYAMLLDVFAQLTVLDLTMKWTPIEKSMRLLSLEGPLLWSRLLWLGAALATLAFTYFRFRFTHPTLGNWFRRFRRQQHAQAPFAANNDIVGSTISMPQVKQTFGFSIHLRQALALAWTSFGTIAKGPAGLLLLTIIATLTVLGVPEQMYNMGTPLLPRTEFVLTFLTAPGNPFTPWLIIPLLIIFYTGELVWRERKAGLGEITEAAPVPEWVFFFGRFLGITLILFLWTTLITLAGVIIQLRMGYHTFEIGLYLQVLFGLQLPDYLLFTLLALVLQGVINQKYVGHLVTLIVYAFILFAPILGIGHNLLVYGSAPAWFYTDMRGFGASLGPWFWFKAYWAAWALFLVVLAKLFWMRGLESGFRLRLRLAHGRFTQATARTTIAALGGILILGGFIFYNTNILNTYTTTADNKKQQAGYERRYGQYKGLPQPRITDVNLRIEIYPERRTLDIQGIYKLLNTTAVPVKTIHLATVTGVETGSVSFNRPYKLRLPDEGFGHSIYELEKPLKPGDSVQLSFGVQIKPKGFRNNGVGRFVVTNSTYFRNHDYLPAIGYQSNRELIKPGERRLYGLTARPLLPSVADVENDVTGEEQHDTTNGERISVETVIGTNGDQVAVAPGLLLRTWSEGGRRYFHFATDAPIGSEYAIFSARYAVHEERWTDPAGSGQIISIQVYHHPKHAANLQRMCRSVQASLSYYTRQFGAYPYSYIRLVENPGSGIGAHAEATTIDYTEGFSLFNPPDDPKSLDLPFAIIAHEMGHQWWGAQLPYAPVEGAGLLTESAAWYSAMGVVQETYGQEHLQRLLRFFRQPFPIPPIRQSQPLLKAADPYAFYRKGPFALYGLNTYMGGDRVNLAYRHLLEAHRSGAISLATSLDLYRELKAVTPDSLNYLLHDLFEANTFWELKTDRPTAVKTKAGAWQVTMNLEARKITVDPAGVETPVPMDEWVQIGVFAPTGEGFDFGETLYLRMHRIHTGKQTITVTVPGQPADAGIDPYHLLIELERYDNVEKVKVMK